MSKCDLNSKILESNIEKINTNNEMGQFKSKVKKNTQKIKEKVCKTVEHDFMCGVVEGFYGRPWTTEQRLDLFKRFLEFYEFYELIIKIFNLILYYLYIYIYFIYYIYFYIFIYLYL